MHGAKNTRVSVAEDSFVPLTVIDPHSESMSPSLIPHLDKKSIILVFVIILLASVLESELTQVG